MMQKKIDEMKAAVQRAENILTVYNEIRQKMEWSTMEVVTDDNGNGVKDADTGEYLYNAPDVDSYCRPLYEAYLEVLSAVEKLVK